LKEKSGVLVAGGGGGSSFGLAGWFGFILPVNKRKVCETQTAQPNGIAWKYKKSVLLCCLYGGGGGGGSLSTLARILYKSFLAGLDLDLDPSTTKYTKNNSSFLQNLYLQLKFDATLKCTSGNK
jgi:hypothetical protein